jgi:RNA polymerase sigma factor (sigma-70 family)
VTPVLPTRLAGRALLRAQSDERLVALLRSGSDAAFEAIVARYRAALLRYCARRLPHDRAEDAVQQTFTRAYEAIRESDSEMHLRAWLYRVAHNAAIDLLRDKSDHHTELDPEIDGVERPDQAFERRERLRTVVEAVGQLPPRQRDALVLREMGGQSYAEIASELGVSDAGVRQLLVRARTTLRAGATAVTPVGLLTRWSSPSGSGAAPHGGDGVAARVAELCAGAGGGVALKTGMAALITGAVVGGMAAAPGLRLPGSGDPAARPSASGRDTFAARAWARGITPVLAAAPKAGPGPGSSPSIPVGTGIQVRSQLPAATSPQAVPHHAPAPQSLDVESNTLLAPEHVRAPEQSGGCGVNGTPDATGECTSAPPPVQGDAPAPGTEGTPAEEQGAATPADPGAADPGATQDRPATGTTQPGFEGVPSVSGP